MEDRQRSGLGWGVFYNVAEIEFVADYQKK
jgi:hypothetical protein